MIILKNTNHRIIWTMNFFRKGFTLVELLIVMVIIGLLATVVFVAINPSELMKRSRDTGRISAIVQLSRSLQFFYSANDDFPDESDWNTQLLNVESMSTFPPQLNSDETTNCTDGSNINQYCYQVESINIYNDQSVVYVQLYSAREIQKCIYATDSIPYFVYTTFSQRRGIVCGQPSAGEDLTFVN
ncbi:MAG: hypothetical protein A2V66_10915 [Ignavibacteria bacterium RBG_13_36_8]|nr:MAG: hypothetical protein A2V66_10915 [Ignavibacteria bacterium RBG_13_36_8]